MTDSELHPYVELIAREARRPVVTDRAARDRVMAIIHAEPMPRRHMRLWERVLQPRAFTLSPVASTLIAAGLVGIGVIAGVFSNNRDVRVSDGQSSIVGVATHLPVSDTVVNFVFVAPQAGKVFVVGDFNDWDATKTPLVRTAKNGLWTVTLPLTAGRHLYSFVVDGQWSTDPTAPLAPDDGFGHSNSVKIVSGGSSL